MNFMALAIISDFDNAFYDSLGDDENKILVEDPSFEHLYEITRTTSRFCRKATPKNQNYLEEEFQPKEVLTNASALEGKGPVTDILVTFAERTM